MKKKFLILSLLLNFVFSFAQNANEVKIDGLGLFSNRYGISYERIFEPNSGVGLKLIMKKSEDYYLTPYYRYYLGGNYDEDRLFFEGIGLYYSYISKDYDGRIYDGGKRNSILGAGFGFGSKIIVSPNFFVEGVANTGVGKVLLPTIESEFKIIIQISASVGYRF